jgi:hypothetical protein
MPIFGIYLEIIWNTSVFSQMLVRWPPHFMQMVYPDFHNCITDPTVDPLTNDLKGSPEGEFL